MSPGHKGYLRESQFGDCFDQIDLCQCLCGISLLLIDAEITACCGSDIPGASGPELYREGS